jgi:hypothetical protein
VWRRPITEYGSSLEVEGYLGPSTLHLVHYRSGGWNLWPSFYRAGRASSVDPRGAGPGPGRRLARSVEAKQLPKATTPSSRKRQLAAQQLRAMGWVGGHRVSGADRERARTLSESLSTIGSSRRGRNTLPLRKSGGSGNSGQRTADAGGEGGARGVGKGRTRASSTGVTPMSSTNGLRTNCSRDRHHLALRGDGARHPRPKCLRLSNCENSRETARLAPTKNRLFARPISASA